MTNLIGLSGRIGSGKDTVGSIIQWLQLCNDFPAIWGPDYNKEACAGLGTFENFLGTGHTWRSDWTVVKFADKLKECASIITGIPRKNFERIDVKNGLISKDWDNLTVRKFLQLFGTEVGRAIHPWFWINALFSDYKKFTLKWDADGNSTLDAYPNWIATDVRFHNEADSIVAKGGILIRLRRNEDVPSDHASETDLDNYPHFDYVIDNRNASIEDLINMVQNILIIEKIIEA